MACSPSKGLANYWGYDTIGFFAPTAPTPPPGGPAAPAGSEVDEFKAMVKALHAEGIEVLLDVVFNHTAEGNEDGPTLCFRGMDNPAYYQLVPGARQLRQPDRLRQHHRCAPARPCAA